MKIITSASYHAVGSSAVTDLFSEFSTCLSLGNYEFRFAQDPDGISDLEYNLVENNHRLNSSQAVKRFLKAAKRQNETWYKKEYKKYFGDNYWKLTQSYIQDIIMLQAKAMWYQDLIDHGELFRFIDRCFNKICKMFHPYNNSRVFSLLKGHEYGYFTYISEEDFIKCTKKYTDALFASINTGKEFMIIDQLVPPSNIERFNRYFNNLLVVVVDRDPRDLYIQEHVSNWGVIPIKTVEEFCQWYEITRHHRKIEKFPSNVCFVRFEDLIYNYEKTSTKLIEFVGLDKLAHNKKYKYFDPKKSIRNTNLVRRFPKYKKDTEYIAERLKEYIYYYN